MVKCISAPYVSRKCIMYFCVFQALKCLPWAMCFRPTHPIVRERWIQRGTQSLQPYYQADRNHTPPCLCVSLTFSSQIPQECVSTKSPRNSFWLEDKVHYSASVPAQSAFSVQSHSCAPWVQGTWWASSPSVPLERAYRTMALYSPVASPLFLFVGCGSGCLGWGSLR